MDNTIKRKCIIGQSGGPTVAINSTLAGVIHEAYNQDFSEVFGMVNGITGLLEEKIVNLCQFKSEENLEKLINTPAMYLGSCRYKIPDNNDEILEKIFTILNKYNITDFFYIGGNDSMDTIKKLYDYSKKIGSSITFIGIPKTIDNDLVNTHYTPGYPSACKYIATTLSELCFDSGIYPIKSVTLIETMGRDAGWLTASASLVNYTYPDTVDFIYLPELPFDERKFLLDMKNKLAEKDTVIVVLSEGIRDLNGNMIATDKGISVDDFGHKANGGCSLYLKEFLSENLKCKVRSIQLSTMQRSAMHLASSIDLDNGFNLGRYSIICALKNLNGIMVIIKKLDLGFENSYVNIDMVANKVKPFPLDWICTNKTSIKQEYIEYILPLISSDYSKDTKKFLKL